MLVDTLGLVLGCVVHAANVQDRDGAKWVLAQATFDFARLRIIRADGGYGGQLVRWVRQSSVRLLLPQMIPPCGQTAPG